MKKSNVTRKVLDAWALMAWLGREEPAHTRVTALFDAASGHRAELSISMINVGEVFYSLAKRRGAAMAEEFLSELQVFPVTVLVPDRRQILEAARIKSRYPLSYADAFAMQAARDAGAELLTGDDEIRKVAIRADVRLEWIGRPT